MQDDKIDLSCNGQPYSESIEHILRKWVNCDTAGLLGVIDAAIIRSNPELSIKCAMSYLYSRAEMQGNTDLIEKMKNFINKFDRYIKYPIDTLLSFKEGENSYKDYTVELSKSGKEVLESYISALREI